MGEHQDWLEEVQSEQEKLQQEPSVVEMFNCINLCQGCIVMQKKEVKPDERFDFVYKSPSEDEGCLVDMARQVESLGYFFSRDS